MVINHFNIQRVHLSLRECLCSCNMGVIILPKLQIEMSIKLKETYIILSMGASRLQSREMVVKYWFRKNNQILERLSNPKSSYLDPLTWFRNMVF